MAAVGSQPRFFDNFRYRPEIDGLRAVAILPVVLYHAGFGCTGGFVGVDVFFVISGFLITSLIWKDLETGRFSFGQFWERRARRIAPPAVVMVLATLVAGWFFLLPWDFKELGKSAVAQAVFAANIFFRRGTGYFGGAAEEMPLLHTWSLAVEEQFYFIVPFLLWGMFHFSALRRRRSVIVLIGSAATVSLAASFYGVSVSPAATFYLLPTRAWELGLGSLLAFVPTALAPLNRRFLREALAVAGLALIVAAVFLYTKETPFPGIAALPPCLGAALVIYANGAASTSVGSLLSTRPLVFIGLISYSLYLWHWPLIAFSRYLRLGEQSVLLRVGLVGAGFIFAVLSWKYVEAPFRERRLGRTRRSMYGYAIAGMATIFTLGMALPYNAGFPARFTPKALKYAAASNDKLYIHELSVEDIHSGRLVPIGATDPRGLPPRILVWGDSHAMAALPAIDALLKERGVAGCAAEHSATPPVLDWYWSGLGLSEDAIAFNNAVLAHISEGNISDVLLIARWSYYISGNMGHERDISRFKKSLLATIRRIRAEGAQPWVMLEVPCQPFDVPRVLARFASSPARRSTLGVTPSSVNELESGIIAELEAAGCRILDPKPAFLTPSKQHYMIEMEGDVLYRDDDHLSAKGASLVLLPFLREAFNPLQALTLIDAKSADVDRYPK
jgi:peptidoglycan/LPS O-acetylase OafA/YrhL